ncbi:MAG: YdbH domain-containing protein, partial [Gammaproteobacteria bacterium]|nr:YdbH domain-containing protein [Gammaproteobacteria bacterium]
PPVLTLHSQELMVTHDELSTALAIEADLGALRSLATQWLPEQPLPGLFDSLSSEGKVEYIVTDNRLGADLDMTLTGVEKVLRGPVSLTYQQGQLALVLKESFSIEARKQAIAQASLPELQLSVKDDINCAYMLTQAAWQCGAARMSLAVPELHYPPYTMLSAPGIVTLHNLSGERDTWMVNADLDLPAVKLALPDNVIRFDRVYTQLQASSDELKATASLQAANGKLAIGIRTSHNMLQQHGKAEIDLQPVSLDATHNIPGKLLRHWPYPLHIEAGELVGNSSVSWQQKNGQFALDQTALVQLDNIQGRFRQYPFSGLRGKLLIKGIDALRITSSDGLRLASINPGLPVTDILVRADVSRQGGKAFVTNLRQFEAMTLGGKINTDKTVLDFNRDENRLILNVQGLDIAELIKLEQKEGLHGTGKLNGKLPIILGKDGLQMSAGKLSAQPPYGVIQYSGDERVTELAKSNPNVELLLKALSDFHYDLLEADLDYAPDGQLLAKVRLQGNNPELEGGRPVHLNINLEENILTLLRSLQFADEISRKIGEGIEQRTQRP